MLFEDVFRKKRIKFKISVKNEGYLHGSHGLLKQALINLVKNSFEATEKGEVILSADKKNKKWIIEVKDTGKGMDEREVKDIFYKGFSTKKYGTGVGLLWVKKIVDAHKGKIEIKSKKGKGTVVKIYLPEKL